MKPVSESTKKGSDYEFINSELLKELIKYDSKMVDKVLGQDECDIDGSFLGFIDTYYYLSKIIPKDWTIIDFGCCYAPQAFYFKNHKSYIGVDVSAKERFVFKNTYHYHQTIKEYLNNTNQPDKKLFVICNYVPSNEVELIKRFKNLYIYYPEN